MAQALAKLGIEHYQWAEVRLITCIDKALVIPPQIRSDSG